MSNLMREMLIVIFWCSLGATVYTYFLYPLLLMGLSNLVRWHRKRHMRTVAAPATNDYMLPGVTMIVSAYNEEEVLSKKITNCQAIDYPADKISFLMGSDGSDDGTWDILQRVTDERFRTIHSHKRCGKVQMLNSLMEMADSDIVVFSDANTMFDSDAIRELVKPFEHSKVGCVIGKLDLTASASDARACRPEGLYWRYENRIKQMESVLGAVPTINGGIFAIRRELFETLPSYAVTEDQVLGMKIMSRGFRCVFADKACASETVSNWAGELRRRIRISAGNFQSLVLVPKILNPRCGRVSFAFFSHKLLRWLVPFFLAGMLLTNILMVGEAFYGSTLVLQGLFYASGVLGAIIPKVTGVAKILSIPKYFLAMNLAILVGFARFVTHRQKVTWAKAQRGDE